MHRKEVTHSNGSYEKKSSRRAWLKKWDKVKIPWYTHRLMYRKRVTCELHDSYFRLMTIKHAIPKIEWAIELLYNSVETGSQWVGDRRAGEKMWQRKLPPSRRGPRAPGWVTQENEKDTTLTAITVGFNILQFCFYSNSLSHTNLYNKVSSIFFKEVFARLYSLRQYVFCMYMCIYAYSLYVEYTTLWKKSMPT